MEPFQVLQGPVGILPAPIVQAIRDTFSTGKAIHDRQVSLPGGAHTALRISTVPVNSGNGRLGGVVVVLNDASAAERLSRKMRRLDRLASIGTLSASMAHEIKNAFVPIKTFVDLLLQQNKSAELAEVVSREIRRVDSIVSQMLRFAGPARPTFAPIDVHTVVDQALVLVQHLLESKNIAIARKLQASPALVEGDAYQLEQVLLNLFFNAVDALQSGGEIRLETELLRDEPVPPAPAMARSSPRLRLSFADSGRGIAPEHLGRLFEPFFTTKPNGTGLGLAITRRIIQEHGGTISVSSQPGAGATFTILLPVSAPAA